MERMNNGTKTEGNIKPDALLILIHLIHYAATILINVKTNFLNKADDTKCVRSNYVYKKKIKRNMNEKSCGKDNYL